MQVRRLRASRPPRAFPLSLKSVTWVPRRRRRASFEHGELFVINMGVLAGRENNDSGSWRWHYGCWTLHQENGIFRSGHSHSGNVHSGYSHSGNSRSPYSHSGKSDYQHSSWPAALALLTLAGSSSGTVSSLIAPVELAV
jgi:hypothetical protein